MLVQFSFDDATLDDIRIVELLDKYYMLDKLTFYWPVMPSVCNEPKGRRSLSLQQMQDIAKRVSIQSHTITHRLLTRISEEEARREIIDSKAMLEDRFGKPITSLAWPRGYTNPTLMKIAEEAGYEWARGVSVGYIYPSVNLFDAKTTAHIGHDRREYAGLPWFSYTMNMITQARDVDNSIVHLWGHSYELAAYPQGFHLFEELLKKLLNEV